mmetsp:Transcript_39478/g.84250  ORF Transcript_39478/g.84250 Transcript_39478/m.84250 type:complete len:107 (+) Transcript_39478:601-921(+)
MGNTSRPIVVVVALTPPKKTRDPRPSPRRRVAGPQRPFWNDDEEEGGDDGQECDIGDESDDDGGEGEEGKVRIVSPARRAVDFVVRSAAVVAASATRNEAVADCSS